MTTEPPSPNFVPTRIIAVELATGNIETPYLTERPIDEYRNVRALARLGGVPIGFVELIDAPKGDDAIVDAVRADAWHAYATEITAAYKDVGLEAPTGPDFSGYQPLAAREFDGYTPFITVSISTLENDEAAMQTAERVLANDYINFELLIIDNSDSPEPLVSKMAERFKKDTKVRHVHEPLRGLSRARNRGWAEAKGEIVAFTDDDVIVDRYWLSRIAAGFGSETNVGAVTGSIVPAELETPAQDWLEQYGGFNKGFERQVYDLDQHKRPEPLYPFDSGRFGSGANIAVSHEALDKLGGFANDLGAGTKAWGGEDIDILRRIVSAGFKIVYEPGALMWHRHRRSYDALRKQMYRYGVGLSATVTKWFLESPKVALQVATRLPLGFIHIFIPTSKKNSSKKSDYPKILSWLEVAGLLVGPFAYVRSRRDLRSVNNSRKQ